MNKGVKSKRYKRAALRGLLYGIVAGAIYELFSLIVTYAMVYRLLDNATIGIMFWVSGILTAVATFFALRNQGFAPFCLSIVIGVIAFSVMMVLWYFADTGLDALLRIYGPPVIDHDVNGVGSLLVLIANTLGGFIGFIAAIVSSVLQYSDRKNQMPDHLKRP